MIANYYQIYYTVLINTKYFLLEAKTT